MISNNAGNMYCGAICGFIDDTENDTFIDYGACDAPFVCQLGTLQGDTTVDMSNVGLCG